VNTAYSKSFSSDPKSEGTPESAAAPASGVLAGEPNYNAPVQPIANLVAAPDFPRNALGQHVDIGGYAGVVVEIVKHSIRVRASEGGTMSYNINTLRRLYGPRVPEEAAQPSPPPAEVSAPAPAPAPVAKRELITEPNFNLPLKPIETVVNRPDYPKCVFGEFIDMHGYTGVVVEIVNGSLKVRSREGTTRSYNAAGLQRLYGKQPGRR
jgi:hypothetical protein